jgi:hypothetical protein
LCLLVHMTLSPTRTVVGSWHLQRLVLSAAI